MEQKPVRSFCYYWSLSIPVWLGPIAEDHLQVYLDLSEKHKKKSNKVLHPHAFHWIDDNQIISEKLHTYRLFLRWFHICFV